MPRIAIAARDFEGCVSTFRDGFGLPVIDLSDRTVETLGVRLAMCVPEGGSHVELMSPADSTAPLSQSLERFLDRRGEGLFALMLEAPDPNAEAEALAQRGLDVLPLMAGAGGRDLHPRSTHGVLIRVYPVDSFVASAEAGSPATCLGLSGIARVLIAVADLERAVGVYGRGLGLAIDEPVSDRELGVRSVICRPPSGGLIELISVADGTKPFAAAIGQFVGQREGLYAIELRTQDLSATARRLGERGIAVTLGEHTGNALEVDPTSAFGARLRLVA